MKFLIIFNSITTEQSLSEVCRDKGCSSIQGEINKIICVYLWKSSPRAVPVQIIWESWNASDLQALNFFFFFKNYQHPKRSVFREPPFKGKKLVFFHPHPPINFWEDTDLYKKSFAQAQGTQRNLQPISIVMYIHFQIHRGVMWNLSVHNNKT